MDDLVDILERSSRRFMEATGHEAVINGKKSGEKTVHILISSYLYGLFEPVAHKMKKEDAVNHVEELKYFFDIGWADILKLKYGAARAGAFWYHLSNYRWYHSSR